MILLTSTTLPGGTMTVSFWLEENVLVTSLLKPKVLDFELYVDLVAVAFVNIGMGLIETPNEIVYPEVKDSEVVHWSLIVWLFVNPTYCWAILLPLFATITDSMIVEVGLSISCLAYFTEIFEIIGMDSKPHLTPVNFPFGSYLIWTELTKHPCLFLEIYDNLCT